jgi:2-dehydro-3-deoxygluconokinase
MTEMSTPLIVGLGEAMIRLTARDHAPLVNARDLTANVAGAELNLLIAASQLGVRGRWLTRLPTNELGTMMRHHAQSFGIDVRAIEEEDARAGLFFLEFGATPRPSKVLYDRRDSAASHLSPDDFDWSEVLDSARVAHVTGITCALGPQALAASIALMGAARVQGVTTSLDVNYRSQLWSEEDARAALRQVLELTDVAFVAPSDLALLTGHTGSVEELARRLTESFNISTLVLRERTDVVMDELGVSVRVLGNGDAHAQASGYVVDQLGAGDAAAGAFLASMVRGDSYEQSVRYCAHAYARMLTLPGDSFCGSWHDLESGFTTRRRLVR